MSTDYPDVLGKLAALESVERHPFEFWRRVGFEVVGVVPDAKGSGRRTSRWRSG